MADLIDRRPLFIAVDSLMVADMDVFRAEVLNLIAEASTVDAEPVVHARWILHPEIGPGDADKECSACGEMSLIWSHYCHSCGARMDADPELEERDITEGKG